MKYSNCFRLIALAVTVYGPSVVAETYRWVDEHGAVHYSDQLPPDQAKHRRSKLNTQGREVEVLEGAKSPEQIERENRLKQLRLEQERILAEQRDRDLSLLRTYRNEEEMNLALQGKLNTLDSLIKITEANKQRQQELLSGHEKRAADIERKGQAIAKNLHDMIETTRRQIASYDGKIKRIEAEKVTISESFAKDIARFKSIKAQHQDLGGHQIRQESLSLADNPGTEGIIISAVACAVGAVCDKAWSLARAYLLDHTSTSLSIDNDKILQTASPRNDRDFAMTVTRIAGKTEDILFLDIRCRPSTVGEELCSSPQIHKIRAGFKPYIEAGLASPAR
ncbi:DUF4124 domain-containing protein [Methylocaldum sp.]|uniref:DUF4124 domain-containing protein n=1 Tax=Methylocaldum sp. TaxID=1969727 RepID=UPI002D2FE623|nr:DUF4124 domain-containing protein [Methylocaldum sp.]HYE35095.1 DUF4124 domain-containing protein [Methylocaldum sp.]